MIYFSSQFSEANSNVIEYNGKKVFKNDRFDLMGKHRIKFIFISSKEKYEQCIVLALLNFEGNIFWNNKKYEKPNSKFPTLDLFEKDYGKEFILDVELESGYFGIYNGVIEEPEDNCVEYCSWGCAMIIEELSPVKKKYYCNDIDNDDDFDDLIFEIEILD